MTVQVLVLDVSAGTDFEIKRIVLETLREDRPSASAFSIYFSVRALDVSLRTP